MLPLLTSLLATAAPALVATVQVTPPRFGYRKDKVELAVTLTNATDRPISLLTGNAANDNYFFALHLTDRSGKVVWDGEAARFVDTDDMPMGVFATVAPHAQYRAVLDWRLLYNLRPGLYKLSVIYRVEPQKEPDAAGLYAGEIRRHHAFTGRVQSSPIDIESR